MKIAGADVPMKRALEAKDVVRVLLVMLLLVTTHLVFVEEYLQNPLKTCTRLTTWLAI